MRAIAYAFGDSHTVGSGASPSSNAYANRIASAKNWFLKNKAVGGTQLVDTITKYYQTPIVPTLNRKTVQSFMLTGFNDYRNIGTDTTKQDWYRKALYAVSAWCAIPDALKVKGQSSAVSYTGTWTNTSVYGGALGKWAEQNGSTATFTVTGSVVYIAAIAMVGGTGGSFSVTVDGVSQGSFNCFGASAPVSGLGYQPFLIRLTGFSGTAHTVVITVTTSSGYVYFDWAAGNSGITSGGVSNVYVGNALKMTSTGYALGSPDWNNGSDAVVAQFNTLIQGVVNNLSTDGLQIYYVDASAAYIIPTDVATDDIHPNNTGHLHISETFLAAMSQQVLTTSKNFIFDWPSTGVSVHMVLRRENDTYIYDQADGAYKSSVASPYCAAVESSVVRGRYEFLEDIRVWDDGPYTAVVYDSSNPASNMVIGNGELYIKDDAEVAQTGDSYTRLGTPAGASVSADIATAQADLDNPAQYKADVSALATQTSVNAIPTNPTLQTVWTDAKAAFVDAAISSRLASAGYTAPDNAGIARLLGLALENHVEDDIVRDGSGNKTGSVIYIYDSAANATTHDKATGLVSSYAMTAAYAAGKMTLFKMVKV